jgi:citronellyl-CoA dehydrogenase
VRDYVKRRLVPYVDEWEAEKTFPREVFKELGDLGYIGIRYPEKYGGSDLDYWYTVILSEELALSGMLGLAIDVMVQSEFAISVINDIGTKEQKDCFLRPAIAGQKLAALGITEPTAGSDVASINTTAIRDGDYYIINGSKIFISNGTRADFVTLSMRTGEKGRQGISLILVPTDIPGFQALPLKKTGVHTSHTAELFFDNCRVPVSNRLGKEGEGFKQIMSHFQGERLILACFANAMMQSAIELASAYGKKRLVFEKPVISYQIWRHRFADVLTRIEASRQLTYHACDMLVRRERAENAISMAKLFATESVRQVVSECYQIFGGYSYMEEYPIARIYRDVSAMTIGAGTSEIMREIIARENKIG